MGLVETVAKVEKENEALANYAAELETELATIRNIMRGFDDLTGRQLRRIQEGTLS